MLTSFLRSLLLVGLWQLGAAGAHAEGGTCPPGMYPANPGSTSGVNACYPIPGYGNQQAQPPAPQWERRWGALATSAPDGILGVSTDKRSKQEASEVAVQDCQSKGGMNCKVELPYYNQCAAVVVGDGAYNTPSAPTVDEAVAMGMKTCRSSGRAGCHVYYSACSLPVRIQ